MEDMLPMQSSDTEIVEIDEKANEIQGKIIYELNKQRKEKINLEAQLVKLVDHAKELKEKYNSLKDNMGSDGVSIDFVKEIANLYKKTVQKARDIEVKLKNIETDIKTLERASQIV